MMQRDQEQAQDAINAAQMREDLAAERAGREDDYRKSRAEANIDSRMHLHSSLSSDQFAGLRVPDPEPKHAGHAAPSYYEHSALVFAPRHAGFRAPDPRAPHSHR